MKIGSVKSFVAALLIVGAAASPSWTQQGGSIQGSVSSGAGGGSVSGATVQALAAGGGVVASSTSDAAGRFTLGPLPAGSYTVVVAIPGYDVRRITGVNVASGQVANVTVDLTTRAVELDPLVISVSRTAERALDAPARVEVVGTQEIQDRPTVAPVDHLRNVAGIDIATSGIQSANVVARGFNNVFSGSLYALTDHRIAGVPSLRVNLLQFIPSTNEDIERMEVVLGPGSALYGPNTANGVLHILTRSPLSDQGTSLAVTGGERSLFHGSFRTAHLLTDNFGFKVSGQYLQADEWRYTDPVEVAERTKFSGSASQRADLMRAVGISEAEANTRIGRIGARDFDVQRWSGEARADWRITPELTTVFSAGATNSNGIELTGLGAGQAVDWRYSYYQARANWRRAFAQVYLNASDAGDTFLLRNGAPIRDESKLFVSQLQHGFELGGRQNFTYGLDYLRTLPETNGTINGIYEDDDETTEIGGYLQSETALSEKFDVVLAGRIDTHSALPEAIFSPRAAVVFKPAQDHAFRLTFNRAFSTPSSLTQFLDLGTPIPNAGAAQLGYSLRVQGTGDEGFRYRTGAGGGYQIRSPFTPTALGGSKQLLEAQQARLFWPAAIQVVAAQSAARGQPLPAQLIGFLSTLNPSPVGLTYFHPTSGDRGALSALNLPDVDPVRESTSNTFEAGYKGLIGNRLVLAADVWYSKRENLVTPLTITTPFVGFDQTSSQALLLPALTQFFTGAFLAAGLPPAQAQAAAQQQAAAQAPLLAGGIAQVPVGVISSPDINANSAQLLITYYNVDDDLDLYGSDLSATALLTRNWSLETTLSLVNEDVFTTRRGDRVTLNAPKTKGAVGLNYRNERSGMNGEARLRYNAAYPVDSGVYRGTACLGDKDPAVEPCVESFSLVDLTLGYRLPGWSRSTIQLTAQNLLDERYRSFPGTPEIGRLVLLRLKYEF